MHTSDEDGAVDGAAASGAQRANGHATSTNGVGGATADGGGDPGRPEEREAMLRRKAEFVRGGGRDGAGGGGRAEAPAAATDVEPPPSWLVKGLAMCCAAKRGSPGGARG